MEVKRVPEHGINCDKNLPKHEVRCDKNQKYYLRHQETKSNNKESSQRIGLGKINAKVLSGRNPEGCYKCWQQGIRERPLCEAEN